MKPFYDFNQRVHLRRDPAQFGRIGRGPFAELAAKSGKTIRQFVFWEHADADLVTCENVADLMSEEEWHERCAVGNNLARYFELISQDLLLIEIELEMDMSTVHTVEIVPGVPDAYGVVKDWIMHINEELFAHVRLNHLGRCEIGFSAWYSDFDYLFKPGESA